MNWPIYIVEDEPRVRRRFWPQDRRARRAADDAVAHGAPNEFLLSLSPAHPANRYGWVETWHLVGQLQGVITSIVTIAVTAS